jgi:hypothetical protein
VFGFSLSGLPRHWRKSLAKKKWFRRLVEVGPATASSPEWDRQTKFGEATPLTDLDRNFPVKKGPPPRERFVEAVTNLAAEMSATFVRTWTGRKVNGLVRLVVDRKSFRKSYDSKKKEKPLTARVLGVRTRWAFVWPRELLELIEDDFPDVLMDEQETARGTLPYTHPFTTLDHVVLVERPTPTYYPPPYGLYSVVPPPPQLDSETKEKKDDDICGWTYTGQTEDC